MSNRDNHRRVGIISTEVAMLEGRERRSCASSTATIVILVASEMGDTESSSVSSLGSGEAKPERRGTQRRSTLVLDALKRPDSSIPAVAHVPSTLTYSILSKNA